MTDPVILYGTQSNGETLPVQVDATGRLVAEGLQGPEGPQGPPGTPGTGELPPNPQEGQILGWENGALAWITLGFTFNLDYLVLGGGGTGVNISRSAWAGGGGGGFISSFPDDLNPGGVPTPGPMEFKVPSNDGFVELDITAGGVGGNSSIGQTGWEVLAIGGGSGVSNKDGGSGGGGSYSPSEAQPPGQGGNPVAGQGFAGGTGGDLPSGYDTCYQVEFECNSVCWNRNQAGGGGGAGGPGGKMTAGDGLASLITGTEVIYCAGGPGSGLCSSKKGAEPLGTGNFGSGGGWNGSAQPGAVMLRVPSWLTISVVEGSINTDVITVGDDQVWTATNGTAVIRLSRDPGAFIRSVRS